MHFLKKQRRKQQKERKPSGGRRHGRSDEKQLHSMKISVWTHFLKNRGTNSKKSANCPENVKTDAPTEGKDRESINRAQVHYCGYTSSAFLKNTAHRHVSKRRRNARKTQRNGGIAPKSTLTRHIAVYHVESRAFHVKQRKNRQNPRF